MKTNRQLQGHAWWAGLATALGVVACGSGFSGNDDCKSTRTCAAAGGETAAADDGGAPSGNTGGADTVTAAGGVGADSPPGGAPTATDAGGAGAVGGAGGAAGPDCRVAKDCSNGDPKDGEERCEDGICFDGNPPPQVVSVTPNDKASGVAPDGSVVIQFSEPLAPASVTAANVQLLDGATALDGEVNYADNKVTFKPKAPLALLTAYTVSVSAKVTDVEGAALLAPFKSSFVVRDGVWSVTTAVNSAVYEVAPNLPVADDGQALVSWVAFSSGHYCPTTVGWFQRGQAVGLAKKLAGDDMQECGTVRAAGSADGRAVVSWHDDDGSSAAIYKGGAWQAKLPLSVSVSALQVALAYGPDDITHYLEVQPGGGLDAYWWKGSKWTGDPVHVSTETVLSEPRTAVAKNGRILAIWQARNVNNFEKLSFATYEPDVKRWGEAVDVKGSVAAGTTTAYERGAPNLALDENGDAMAVWVRGSGNGSTYQLMGSRYRTAGWEDPVIISGALTGLPRHEPASLVFDGKTFVAAWSAVVNNVINTYVARFDRKSESWGEYQLVSNGTTSGLTRMPKLGADAHQNLLLTWAMVTNVANVFDLAFQRYNANTGAWGVATAVPGGSMVNAEVAKTASFPLGVGGNGLAAAVWGTLGSNGLYSAVNLASFY